MLRIDEYYVMRATLVAGENLSATGPCFSPNFYGQFGKTETVVDHRL